MVEVYLPDRIKEDYVRDCFQYIFDQMCIEGMDIDYFLELTGINIVSPDEECYERNKIYSFIRYLWLFEEYEEGDEGFDDDEVINNNDEYAFPSLNDIKIEYPNRWIYKMNIDDIIVWTAHNLHIFKLGFPKIGENELLSISSYSSSDDSSNDVTSYNIIVNNIEVKEDNSINDYRSNLLNYQNMFGFSIYTTNDNINITQT